MRFTTVACTAALIACVGVNALPVNVDSASVVERDIENYLELDVREVEEYLEARRKKTDAEKAHDKWMKEARKAAKKSGEAAGSQQLAQVEQTNARYKANVLGTTNHLVGVHNNFQGRDFDDDYLEVRRKKTDSEKAHDKWMKEARKAAKKSGEAAGSQQLAQVEQTNARYKANVLGTTNHLVGVHNNFQGRDFDDEFLEARRKKTDAEKAHDKWMKEARKAAKKSGEAAGSQQLAQVEQTNARYKANVLGTTNHLVGVHNNFQGRDFDEEFLEARRKKTDSEKAHDKWMKEARKAAKKTGAAVSADALAKVEQTNARFKANVLGSTDHLVGVHNNVPAPQGRDLDPVTEFLLEIMRR